jgi:hypothetical protein
MFLSQDTVHSVLLKQFIIVLHNRAPVELIKFSSIIHASVLQVIFFKVEFVNHVLLTAFIRHQINHASSAQQTKQSSMEVVNVFLFLFNIKGNALLAHLIHQ